MSHFKGLLYFKCSRAYTYNPQFKPRDSENSAVWTVWGEL